MPSALRTVFDWLRVADPFIFVGYGAFTLIRRRREQSVRRLTRTTATGVGIAIAIAVALFAFTLLF